MGSEKKGRCRICHVEKSRDELNQNGGRCHSCMMAKQATDQGITYGKMQGITFSAMNEKIAEKERLLGLYNTRRKAKKKESDRCRKCGGFILAGNKYEGFCCRECKAEYEKQQMDAVERGAIADAPPVKNNLFCVNCGKALTGKQLKYCCKECDAAYNAERRKQYYAERAEQEKSRHTCRVCGKPVTEKKRSKYCSIECAKIGEAMMKKERKNNENDG